MADQFKSGRGGDRRGLGKPVGRPPGSPNKFKSKPRSDKTELLGTRLTPEEKAKLLAVLEQMRKPPE